MTTPTPLLSEHDTDPHGLSLTAADILQQKFAVRFRGYDVHDVDSFLEIVAREVDRLHRDCMMHQEECSALKRELETFRKKEESINAALMNVQRIVDDVKVKATTEAERLVRDAREEAERILAEAHETIRQQRQEMESYKSKAEAEGAAILDKARHDAEHLIQQAQQKAAASHTEADAIKEQALQQARKVLDDARKESERMMTEIQKKSADVYEKLGVLQEKAQAEAQKLIDDARAEILRMKDEAAKERAQIQEELNLLVQRKYHFQAALRTLIETHLKLLECGDQQQ